MATTNPWYCIPLADYEGHMELPEIGQSQYISQSIDKITKNELFNTVTIIGCAGGNGFDKLLANGVNKIIGIDINPEYINTAKIRFPCYNFNVIIDDICDLKNDISNVDLVIAALVFEYIDIETALNNIYSMLSNNGQLFVILQAPNKNINSISTSKYQSLKFLGSLFQYVSPDELISTAHNKRLILQNISTNKLPSGKEFHEILFVKKQ